MADIARGGHADLPPLWRQREYMLLWSGQVVSSLGSHASGIVVTLLILALVPYIVLSLPVGVWVDRWNRQHVMLWCDLGRALASASVPLALWFDALTLGQLYMVAAVHGTLLVFFNLAEVAALPKVVATAQLPQAIAQNQAGHSAAAIAGPALGSWLYQHLGRSLPFVLDALSYLASALTIWRLRTPLAAVPASAPRNLRAEMMVGLRWLWGQALVRRMAVVTCLSNFVSAAPPLLLIVLAKAQGAGEAQIGLVFSAGGVGGLLGALAGGWVSRRFSFGAVIVGTLALQALLLPALALVPGTAAMAAVYGVMMFCAPIYNVVQLSRRLAMIPDGLQGRVNSAYRMAANLLYPVGAALCGLLIEHWGAVPALAAFTTVALVLAAGTAASRVIRHEGLNPPPAESARPSAGR
jgi:predicted MFS family arabinose efflux permease